MSGMMLCLGLRLISGNPNPFERLPSIGETAILALRPEIIYFK